MCCYHGLNQSALIAYAQMSITPNMAMCGSRGGIGGLYPLKNHKLYAFPPWKKLESNLRPLVYKARGLSTTPQRLLSFLCNKTTIGPPLKTVKYVET